MLKEKMKRVYENQSFDDLSDLYRYIGHFIIEENGEVKMVVKDHIHALSSPYMFSFRPNKTKFDDVEEEILLNRGIILGVNTVLLDEDYYLVNWYGKYNPQMTFLVTWETIQNFFWSKPDYFMNVIFDGEPHFMYGDYWISRKGKHCFRPLPKDRAEHMLVKVEWEREKGARGINPELEEVALYSHRARSNGGGIGNTYYVLPKGYIHKEKLEDYLPKI